MNVKIEYGKDKQLYIGVFFCFKNEIYQIRNYLKQNMNNNGKPVQFLYKKYNKTKLEIIECWFKS